ncbi:MAG: N-acyl amino acid synthase FeeM domain-containing protein, partial [Gammaproteobacteria bacterium]
MATEAAQRRAVFAFRYQVYVEQMGKQPAGADHENGLLTDSADDDASILYLSHGANPIATLRLNGGPFSDHLSRDYGLERFSRFADASLSASSRLMIAAEWRGSSVLGTLLREAYRMARTNGSRFDFCYCTPALVSFYEQLGYRRYKSGFEVPGLGYRVPLVLVSGDLEHLQRVRSPFLKLARAFGGDDEAADWFRREFPEAADFANRRVLGADEFWSVLGGKLGLSGSDSVPLFQGLDDEQVKRFSSAATLMNCKAGDALIQPG